MPVFQLNDDLVFPPPALAEKDGLLAVGGDLSPERLLLAYGMGIFPWYSEGDPILWWSPSPRLVIRPAEFRLSRRLARLIRQKPFQVTFDQDFRRVIQACAGPRRTELGTWITAEMIEAYIRLHEMGCAHSVECWQDGKFAGGLYGVSLGGIFFGESMCSRVTNSSKVALASLVVQLQKWNFELIDCQLKTAHLLQFGAREIPGREFQAILKKNLNTANKCGTWAAGL